MQMLPFQDCPRYDRCSVNRCPLDPEIEKRTLDAGDKEKKCPMRKSVRVRIGGQYPDLLPLGGLTAPEFASRRRWDSMSESQQQAKREALSAARAKSGLKTLLKNRKPS